MSRNIKEFLELLKGMVDILDTSGWNLMGIAHYAIRLVIDCYAIFLHGGN